MNGAKRFFIASADAAKLADFQILAARAGLAPVLRPGLCRCYGAAEARAQAAGLLTALVFGPWELQWLSQLIESRYDFFSAGARQCLLEKALLLTEQDDFCWGLFAGLKREQRLQAALAAHWHDFPLLQLEGFMRFRLVGYREYLHTLLSLAADELLAEEEDQECLLLLREFLTARPLGGEIHVFLLRQGRYDICAVSAGSLRFLEGGLLQGCEDMLVTALMQLAPRRLFFHLQQPLPAALQDLLSELFGARLKLELGCGPGLSY